MVNRKLLYWGVFLVVLGGVLLAGQSPNLDVDLVAQALRLWPIVIIALGVGLLVRRTAFALPGGLVAAAMPGLLLGGIVVAAPTMAHACNIAESADTVTRQGDFSGHATVDLRLDCGDLAVTTAPGTRWEIQTASGTGVAPDIDASPTSLAIASVTLDGRHRFPWREPFISETYAIRLPTGTSLDLSAEVNAGRGRLDLAGARLGNLDLQVNAGELRVDLSGATLEALSFEANAASASVLLPAGEFRATFDVNGADLNICAPLDLGIRLRDDVVLGSRHYPGLIRSGAGWETPGYLTAPNHADVTVSVNVGSVSLNPEGGCK